MLRWTKELPFGVMLVHRSIYDTQEQAEKDLPRIAKEVFGFDLLSDEDISASKCYKITTPFKEKTIEEE